MASHETPAVDSSSSGQAVQLEATNAAKNLDMLDIDDGLAVDKPGDSCRYNPLTVVKAIDDPEGEYSAIPVPDYNGQNAPLGPVPGSTPGIQTGNSTVDHVYEENFLLLEYCKGDKDPLNYICYDQDTKVPMKERFPIHNNEHKDVDEVGKVDGKSSDRNIASHGTKATGKAESATLQQQNVDFSATATAPNDISVRKVITSSSEPLQKPEEVEEEGVSVKNVDHTSFNSEPNPDSQKAQHSTETEVESHTGDVVNKVTVHDEAKEDEEDGGIVLNHIDMFEGGTNNSNKALVSTFGAVNDKPAPATGVTTSTTANDVRLAVPSLEPLAKRAKVKEDIILVNAEHTSSSAARP